MDDKLAAHEKLLFEDEDSLVPSQFDDWEEFRLLKLEML